MLVTVRPIIRIWITLIAAAVYPRRVLHTCCVLLAIVFSFKCAVLHPLTEKVHPQLSYQKKVSIFCKLLSVSFKFYGATESTYIKESRRFSLQSILVSVLDSTRPAKFHHPPVSISHHNRFYLLFAVRCYYCNNVFSMVQIAGSCPNFAVRTEEGNLIEQKETAHPITDLIISSLACIVSVNDSQQT